MLHRNFQGAIATHRRAADSSRRSRRIYTVCRLDHGNELRDDGVLPFFTAVTHVRIEARTAKRNGNNELSDFALGNHTIHDLVGLAPCAPARFIFKQSMEEI